ncbi:hypothetical protein J6590_090359 [Homalodisca vitripennis]|nr:hypothetical protein J6590_090359 [Homalodisca vitripennis]
MYSFTLVARNLEERFYKQPTHKEICAEADIRAAAHRKCPPFSGGEWDKHLLVSVLSADHDDQDNPSPIPETFRTPPCCLTPMMMSPDLWAFRQRSPRAINDTAAEDLLLGCPHGDSTTAVSATAVARNPQAPPPAHADSSTPGYSEDRYHPCPVPLRHVPVIQRIQCCDPRPGPTLCLSGSSQHL